MKRSFVKCIGASALFAAVVFLSSCGGGSSSSSSGGSSIAGGKTIVQGNISNSGAVSALIMESGAAQFASGKSWDLWQGFIPVAQAQTNFTGWQVCIQELCDDEIESDGSFMLVLDGITPGPYVITISDSDGTDYSAQINVKNNAITSLDGIILEEGGTVKITNIRVTVTSPASDPEEGPEEDSEDEPEEKFIICHKPGTPAQQNLAIPESALAAHIEHGDSNDNGEPLACDEIAI